MHVTTFQDVRLRQLVQNIQISETSTLYAGRYEQSILLCDTGHLCTMLVPFLVMHHNPHGVLLVIQMLAIKTTNQTSLLNVDSAYSYANRGVLLESSSKLMYTDMMLEAASLTMSRTR